MSFHFEGRENTFFVHTAFVLCHHEFREETSAQALVPCVFLGLNQRVPLFKVKVVNGWSLSWIVSAELNSFRYSGYWTPLWYWQNIYTFQYSSRAIEAHTLIERRVGFRGVTEENAAEVCDSLQPLAYILCICVGDWRGRAFWDFKSHIPVQERGRSSQEGEIFVSLDLALEENFTI